MIDILMTVFLLVIPPLLAMRGIQIRRMTRCEKA
jgi:hypothetical protein